jgi:major membrane immunogen (membrane-anchored lipoprotein)
MKANVKVWTMSMLVAGVLLVACNDDDNGPSSAMNEKTYTLAELDSSGVSGTVTFRKQNDSTTKVTVRLTGTQAGDSHPAHIHANAASEGGPIVLDFNPVDGASGMSETTVTKFNDGTPVTYEKLINYDGHVNVHKSAMELSIMIAQGNIGSNATGTSGNGGNTGNNGGY